MSGEWQFTDYDFGGEDFPTVLTREEQREMNEEFGKVGKMGGDMHPNDVKFYEGLQKGGTIEGNAWPKVIPPEPLRTREQIEKDQQEQLRKLKNYLDAQRQANSVASNFEQNKVRSFTTGATRDSDMSKNDYEGFISPIVLEAYGDFMNENRIQPDGKQRASDNWQLGIPKGAYMSSLLRHVLDLWKLHRGWPVKPEMRGGELKTPTTKSVLCAIMFNVMGYLHEVLKEDLAKSNVQQTERAA